MANASNALATTTPKALIERRMEKMMAALPSKKEAERFRQAALAVAMAPSIAECEPQSVYSAVYACFRMNIVPDPVLKEVFIVPFKKKATLVLGYPGVLKLARNADPGLSVRTGTVYENDDYVLEEGLYQTFSISKRWWQKRDKEGNPTQPGFVEFCYCVYKFPGADPQLVIVPYADLHELANKSKAGNRAGTPWHDHFAAMGEKTAIKRAAKLWTMQAERREEAATFKEAMRLDEADPEDIPEAPGGDELDGFGDLAEGERSIGSAAVAPVATPHSPAAETGAGESRPRKTVQSRVVGG